MKVQKIKVGSETAYILLSNNYERFEEVDAWVCLMRQRSYSPQTIKTDLYNLKHYYEFTDGIGVDPINISPDGDPRRAPNILIEFINHLSRPENSVVAINGRAPKGMSDRHINQIISTVRCFYEAMGFLGIYDAPLRFSVITKVSKYATGHPLAELFNNARTVKKDLYHRPVAEKTQDYITREQYNQLLDVLDNKRDKLLAALLFECGLRIGEVLGLKWEDLDNLENNRLKVVFRNNNENGARAKYRENRELLVQDYIVDMILDYEAELEQHEKKDHVSVTHGFVFSGQRRGLDQPMKYPSAYDIFKRASKKLGYPVHPHMLRHGFANEKLAKGFDANEVRKMMGHRHVKTTIDEYASTIALTSDPNFREKFLSVNYNGYSTELN